ncbi:hypothetical protein Nmel_005861 [Mimus melanotis]
MGVLGAVEIKCLLATYMNFQILVFVMQMAILVLIIRKKEEVCRYVNKSWGTTDNFKDVSCKQESLTEQESMWNILNAMQHDVKKKAHKI